MITNNFKMVLALILQSYGNSNAPSGLLPVKDTSGTTRYLGGGLSNTFPSMVSKSVTFSNLNGIYLGTGTTAPSESDYQLEAQITTGLTAATSTETRGFDSGGNPYMELLLTLTNTTSSDIVVHEIGYVQQFRLADSQGGNIANTARYLLLDRTVLDTPVTVPANDSAAIKYTLKTVLASS